MSLQFSSGVLNQLGAPAIYEDLIANRPAAGYKGRVFIGTDNFNIYRDNGTTWNQLGGSASGTVTSIIGTANQVIASSSTGSVTLSLPQSINISNSPTFTGLTLSGLSAAGVVVNNGSGVIATAAGTGFLKMAAGVISFDNSAYITLASLSANTPLSYNSGTGAFSIQVANTSQNGYITSTDWNTFNGKQATIAAGTGVSISGGNTINIGQAVGTGNSPTFAGLNLTSGGQTSPGTIVSTNGDNSALLFQSGGSVGYVSSINIRGGYNGSGQAGGYINFATQSVERMRVHEAGYILIGSTSNHSSEALQVTGTSYFTGNLTCTATGTFSTISVAGYTYTTSTTITGGYFIVYGSGGSAGQTLTFPAASGTNQQLFFKNVSSNTVTLSRAGSDNLFLIGTSVGVSTTVLAVGGQAGFVSDGNNKWIQQY